MSYYVELEEDANGDLIMTIPEEVIETLGWETGDTPSDLGSKRRWNYPPTIKWRRRI